MSLQIVHAAAVNMGPRGDAGCDAFAHQSNEGVFVMADGANSCPNAGPAAQWLCQEIAREMAETPPVDASGVQALVQAAHGTMQVKQPASAATLLSVRAHHDGVDLACVGDSVLLVFQGRALSSRYWSLVHEMPRDMDSLGHPTQLIGSPVCRRVHTRRLPPDGRWLLLLMTDGPGDALAASALQAALGKLGRAEPSPDDLDYLCRDLAHQALNTGCRDDISVAMIWIQYRRKWL